MNNSNMTATINKIIDPGLLIDRKFYLIWMEKCGNSSYVAHNC